MVMSAGLSQCLTMTTKVGENRRAVCLSKLKLYQLNRANNKKRRTDVTISIANLSVWYSRMDRLRSLSLSSLTYVRQKNHNESGKEGSVRLGLHIHVV